MNRFTFVVHVQPDGPSTVENLSTREQVRVPDLEAVGPQIERWLQGLENRNQKAMPDSASDEGSSNEQQ